MIPVNTPLLEGRELEYLTDCIETGWISSEGAYVRRFEDDVARYTERTHGIAVVNGTAALQIAIEALEIEPGREVVVPTFSIISCAASIVRAGLVPVPVDCDVDTFNMSVSGVRDAVSDRTAAIMIVHTYGLPVDMDPILAIAAERGLKVIEDAAEVIGQTYRGKPCGSFGDVSTFSFYPNKHVTTGEGGMVLTDSDEIAERSRLLRNLAFEGKRRFVHRRLGWNYRMSNLQAAVGCAQLECIEEHLRLKRKIGAAYNEHMQDVPRVILPTAEQKGETNVYWVYAILLGRSFPMNADVVMSRLRDEGIGTRPMFWPLHRQPVLLEMFPELADVALPNAEYIAAKGLYLPSGLGLDIGLIPEICNKVRHVLDEF